eukprot:1035855-Amphidinium_carterae.2
MARYATRGTSSSGTNFYGNNESSTQSTGVCSHASGPVGCCAKDFARKDDSNKYSSDTGHSLLHHEEVVARTEYSRIGIGRDIMRQPRSAPVSMRQVINWIEDFFNRYVVAVSVNASMEPKEILAFVMSNVKPTTANDLELSMTWIDLKKRYDVTLKTFSHEKLELLLRELIQLHCSAKAQTKHSQS